MDFTRPRVLIVDDSAFDLETLRTYLEEVAMVHTVTSGKLAIECVQQHEIDVILLDIEMPIMDGFQTLEHLRKMQECINVPVILVTGMKDKHTVLSSMSMGIDGYMLKPVKKEDLQEKVLEVFANRRGHRYEKKTVLLIDDEMSYLKQLYTFLQDEFNVIMINSAKLALEYLLTHTPDVIVLDYQMPLYNGANMMNLIQKSKTNIEIPIIILSGTLSREALQECYTYNPTAFLAKPVSKEVLIDTISQAINQ